MIPGTAQTKLQQFVLSETRIITYQHFTVYICWQQEHGRKLCVKTLPVSMYDFILTVWA